MKLSILIPNYNGGNNIVNAIMSCKAINLPLHEFEILVVDNNSSDNSVHLIEKCCDDIPNIRIIRNKSNIGRVENWNKCLECAVGDYALFLMVNDTFVQDFDFYDLIYSVVDTTAYINDFIILLKNNKLLRHNHNRCLLFQDIFECDIIINEMLDTVFQKFDLGPIQTLLIDVRIVRLYNIKFNCNLQYLSDVNFIIDYLGYFKYVRFHNYPIIKWNSLVNRFAFSRRDLFFSEFISIIINRFGRNRINFVKISTYMLVRLLIEMLIGICTFHIPVFKNRFYAFLFVLKNYKISILKSPLVAIYYLCYWIFVFILKILLSFIGLNFCYRLQ